MCKRILNCVLTGGFLLAYTAGTAQAYDLQQIATDRGNVPLYLPSGHDSATPLPLVVSLHGYTGNGTEHENYFNLRSRVDDRQFMLCVPNGLTNSQGDRFWNATDYCCDFNGQNPDDSGYLRGLIETINVDYPLDLGSIHVVGHSNGGFMSYRMACENADLVASIASLAGATFSDESDCTPSEPVHVLQIHGTSDTTINFNGSCFPFFGCYPSALESILLWSQYNQCNGDLETGTDLDIVANISGAETTRTLITEGCAGNGSSELWAINGGSHGPNFNGNFPRELVDWLLAHRRMPPSNCIADLNVDGIVDGADLTLLLATWGSSIEMYDLNGNDIVDGGDLNILLGAWGACSS